MTDIKKLICDTWGSQTRLAKKMNWSKQRLNGYILGKTMPKLDDASTLAKALNISEGELVEKILHAKSIKS